MPKINVEPVSVSPEDFIEACLPRDIERVIHILKEDFEDDLISNIRLSPEDFLDKCHSGELEATHNILHNSYGIGEDEDARSEGQRQFNHHLTCLKESWLSISKEDAGIIAIIAKKYGAL
jgi:hypothetical protein